MIRTLKDYPRYSPHFRSRQRFIRLATTGLFALLSVTVISSLVHPFARTLSARARVIKNTSQLAHLGDHVTFQAAGRGRPEVNLEDGRELLTSFVGDEELQVALEQNQAVPLSLASADFDEDGVPDLVSGYGFLGRGIVTLMRGNVDAIYPNSPEAKQRKANGTFTDAPFLSPARIFAASVSADFIGAGDFDADGHWDLAIVSKTKKALCLFSGDGRGEFASPREIALQGFVTAMTTGEVNRADGLTDLVIGVTRESGSEVLVFEGPEGAFRSDPEVLPVKAPVSSLALGQLDSEYNTDLAIAAGNELIIVQGRDRKLSSEESQRAKVPPAVTSSRIFEAQIKSITVGHFTAGDAQSIVVLGADGNVDLLSQKKAGSKAATKSIGDWQGGMFSSGASSEAKLISAHVSTSGLDDLLVVDAVSQQIQIWNNSLKDSSSLPVSTPLHLTTLLEAVSAPVAVLPTRLNGDALSDLMLLSRGKSAPAMLPTQATSTFVVANTNPSGSGSLQFAILDANESPGADLITFSIPGTGTHIISPTAPLPAITDPVTIDGTSQPGYNGTPVIELRGNAVGVSGPGLAMQSGNSTVRALSISRFIFGGAISLRSNNNLIEGNVLFTPLGSGANGYGVNSEGSAQGNIIGGTTTQARNFISNNGDNINLQQGATNNIIRGNFIGTDATGTSLGGGVGVAFGKAKLNGGTSNLVGGTVAGARNIISSIQIYGMANLIQGNYIGTDVTGLNPLGGSSGIIINDSLNAIGGTTTAARNLISGGIGIRIFALGCLVQGNYIGTNVNGQGNLGSSLQGVFIQDASDSIVNPGGNTIGGAVAGAGNLIANSTLSGVEISGGQGGHSVQGNLIGTDASGIVDLGNGQNGVLIHNSPNNVIGGTDPAQRNVISGNGLSGVLIEGAPSTGNIVLGNFIGTNAAGTGALGNDLNGVTTSQAPNNTIGGANANARNIISANARHGVSIGIDSNSGATGITVRNNYIGTDVTGTACLGNQRDGVFVNRGSVSHTISDNLITCNARNGVNIPNFITNDPGIRITVTDNSIFANALLGIDLGDAGITANDPGDADGGANFQQNFPVLTSFVPAAQFEQTSVAAASTTASNNGRKPASVDAVTVNGTLNSNPNTTFTVHWYFTGDSQCATNQAATRPLASGKIPLVTTDGSGNAAFNFPFDFPTSVNTGIINCTATDSQGNTSEFSACLPVSQSAALPAVQFSQASYSKTESGPTTNITVTRTGDTSGASSVNFGTGNNSYVACNQINGQAVQNCDFILSSGTLTFVAGQASRTFPIIIIDDLYVEGPETISLTLSAPTGAVLGAQTTATLTLTDNDVAAPTTNPLDDPTVFVTQHYYDFLGRQPDDGGRNYWVSQITVCAPTDTACINERRVAVSNAFFFEQEYQQTASYVFLLYRAAYGNDQPFPNPDWFDTGLSSQLKAEAKKLPRYLSFVRDRAQVVGGSNLAQAQLALANAFVQRTEFITKYPTSLSGAQFVDAVLATIQTADGATLAVADRTALITHFNNGGRGLVMFHLANDYWNDCNRLPGSPAAPCVPAGFGAAVDNRPFIEAEYNRSFVYSQYSGYLRRDSDIGGFLFWLTEVSKSPPRNVPRQRAMVCSFMTSTEYQQRLSPVATHNNSECPPPP